MIRTYSALIRIHLKLALREKNVLFFNYAFPLIFFFGFGQFMGTGGMISRVVAMVMVIGILGNGLFGAGLRAVLERETNILRRYKVTPIGPAPLLVASMITGWLLYLPSAAIVLLLARVIYQMPWPQQWLSLFVLLTLGCFAFRAIGLIVASIANSMAEANVMIQLLYMPMLFLSGATIPVSVLPLTAQIIAQFLPASYLHTGMQQILLGSESLAANPEAIGALITSTLVALWISFKLFRWEKEEKIPAKSKTWVAAAFLPFIMLGGYQAYTHEHIQQTKLLDRQLRRNFARLIRDARIFTGDGRVIERGSVLLKDGRIARIFEGTAPDADSLNADALEAVGKTVMPGLIDVHVHLGAPAGANLDQKDYNAQTALRRAAAAYLYSGVTAVRSTGDFTSEVLKTREAIGSGVPLGAEIRACGPVFTAPGGYGTEYFQQASKLVQEAAEREFTRIPKTPGEARQRVRELKSHGVDCIKAILEAGVPGMLFQRLDVSLLRAIGEEARALNLPLVIHTGDSQDISDALEAGATSIEHGSSRDRIPDALLEAMKRRGVYYNPTLSVAEALLDIRAGSFDLLDRTLVQQVAPSGFLATLKKTFSARKAQPQPSVDINVAMENLVRAWKAGVPIVTGTDSGNPLLVHGPAIHRELQLWVKAGIPASAALQAATYTSAKLLRIDGRTGRIQPGYDATLLILDGNPLQDISTTERLSAVFLKGE